jgi:hypothetical protein
MHASFMEPPELQTAFGINIVDVIAAPGNSVSPASILA